MQTRHPCFLRFRKVNGQDRDMYCFITAFDDTNYQLHDLGQHVALGERRCNPARVGMLISRGVRYLRR